MQKSMMKAQKAQKKTQVAAKKPATKVQKRKVATKKVVKKATVAPASAPMAMMSTTIAAPKPAKITMVGLPKNKATAVVAPVAAIKAAPMMQSAAAFKASMKALNNAAEGAVELSPAKVIYQAQKQLQIDTLTLQKELGPELQRDLAQRNMHYTVNDEGVITLKQKKHGYNIEFVFDREFEFAEQEEEEPNQEQEQEGDEGKYAFHNITITLTKAGSGSLRLGGQLHLNSDLKLQTFTPFLETGTELRTVSTEDLSDAAVNSIFDALEVICLSDQDCGAIIEVARQERLTTHLQSLDFLTSFFESTETH